MNHLGVNTSRINFFSPGLTEKVIVRDRLAAALVIDSRCLPGDIW